MDLTLDENMAFLAPIPFNTQQCRLALALKEAGLPWAPHVGCFVWDPNEYITASSPFPGRVYFILKLEHFLRYFPSFEVMSQQLIWLPTWHQTRLLCAQFGVENEEIRGLWKTSGALSPGDDLFLCTFCCLVCYVSEKDRRVLTARGMDECWINE